MGLFYRGLWETSNRRLWERIVSLSFSVFKLCEGNLGEGSCTEVSGSYVKEGSGDRASISMQWLRKENLEGVSLLGNPRDCQGRPWIWIMVPLYRLRNGNMEGGFLYWGLREIWNGRRWKRIISFIGLHEGNLRHLVREGSANMLVGLEPLLVYSYTLQGLWSFFFVTALWETFLSGLGQPGLRSFRKTHPR